MVDGAIACVFDRLQYHLPVATVILDVAFD